MAKSLIGSVTDTTWSDVVGKADGLTLVLFGAAWCGPCGQIKENVEAIAKQNAGVLNVLYYDVDLTNHRAASYNVRGVPTLILFDGENKLATLTGLQPVAKIQKGIDSHLSQEVVVANPF